jgi:hypothetical protein
MIARYNTLSFIWGIPGLIIQIAGYILRTSASNTEIVPGKVVVTNPLMFNLGFAIVLVGTVLFLVGLAYYAKAKGRSPWWCLFAFLSCIGLLVLACLKDHAKQDVKVSLINPPNN